MVENTRMLFIKQSACLAGFIPAILMGLLVAGCGNKTLPKPLSQTAPPQVHDLRAVVSSKGVELSWSMPDQMKALPKDSLVYFSIWKSEVKWENRDCLDCPSPNQQEVQKIDPAQPYPATIQDNRLVWLDTVVSKNHAYRYQINIQERRGRQLSQSKPVLAKVVPAPQPPRDLQANTQQNGVLLHWKASNKDISGQPLQGELEFMVERHAPNGAWEKASSVHIKGNSFLDNAVSSNEVYDYRVTPVLFFEGSPIQGEPNIIRQVKAPGAIPPPPPKSVWVLPGKGAIEVHWTETDGKAQGYHVYRREGKEITRLTSTPVQHPPYVDRNVKRNSVYYYAVSAVNTQPAEQEGLVSKWVEIRNLFE